MSFFAKNHHKEYDNAISVLSKAMKDLKERESIALKGLMDFSKNASVVTDFDEKIASLENELRRFADKKRKGNLNQVEMQVVKTLVKRLNEIKDNRTKHNEKGRLIKSKVDLLQSRFALAKMNFIEKYAKIEEARLNNQSFDLNIDDFGLSDALDEINVETKEAEILSRDNEEFVSDSDIDSILSQY